MIETRYQIEYINPKPSKLSSKLSKFLIYTILSLSILGAVLAGIFVNLPKSTTNAITEKAQHFVESFKTQSTPDKENIAIEEAIQVTAAPQVEEPKISPTQLEKEYKLEIERLSQENIARDELASKQLKENKEFSEKLAELSTQLADEKLRYTELTKELTALNLENTTVSSLLKETNEKAESYAKELKELQLKQSKVAEVIKPKETSNNQNNSEVDAVTNIDKQTNNNSSTGNKATTEVVKRKDDDKEEPTESLETKETVAEIVSPIEIPGQKKPEISQIDAIVATMENAAKASDTQNKELAKNKE